MPSSTPALISRSNNPRPRPPFDIWGSSPYRHVLTQALSPHLLSSLTPNRPTAVHSGVIVNILDRSPFRQAVRWARVVLAFVVMTLSLCLQNIWW